MEAAYWLGAHTQHRLLYHFTFIPKYRKRILRYKVIKRIRELFKECCQGNQWEIHQLEILEEHVHLLLQIKPTDNPAKVMFYLKGGSSKVLREEFPELKAFLLGDSFWADGYYVETIGKRNERAIRKYLSEQQIKHRK